jgi:hypothetical protein
MDPLLYKLIWVFGWSAVLLVIWYVRGQRRQRRLELIHAERMAAIEKGIPLPEMPDYEALAHPSELRGNSLNPRWPLGVGTVIAMLGLGLCAALFLSGDEYHNQIWPFGLIGVFLGVGLMLHYFLMRSPNQ